MEKEKYNINVRFSVTVYWKQTDGKNFILKNDAVIAIYV